MKNIILSFAIFLFLFTYSCFTGAKKNSGKIPLWVTEFRHKSYSSTEYLQGVGSAVVKENKSEAVTLADQAARNEIANQIRISIMGEVETINKEINLYDDKNLNPVESMSSVEYKQRVKTKFDIRNLEGLQIQERYFDEENNICYSFALLEISKSVSSLKQKIEGEKKKALEYHKAAEIALTNRKVSDYFKFLSGAEEILLNLSEDSDLLFAITRNKSKGEIADISAASVRAKILEGISNLKFVKIGGDKQQAEINKGLPLPLEVKLSFKTKDEEYPVENIPVIFKLKEPDRGKLAENVVTDSKGVAKCEVYNLLLTGEKYNSITAFFNPLDVGIKNQNKASVSFVYTLPAKEDLRIGLLFLEEYTGEIQKESQVASKVAEELVKIGYKIKNESGSVTQELISNPDKLLQSFGSNYDVFILGKIIVEKKGEEPFQFVEGKASVSIMEMRKGTVFSVVDIAPKSQSNKEGFDTKGLGLTRIQAVSSSIEKISPIISKFVGVEMERFFNKNGTKEPE